MEFIKSCIRALANFFDPPDPIYEAYLAAAAAAEAYQQSEKLEDIKTAVEKYEITLALCRDTLPHLAPTLVNYAVALFDEYLSEGEKDAAARLDRIIWQAEEALDIWQRRPPQDRVSFILLLTNLGNAYGQRATHGIAPEHSRARALELYLRACKDTECPEEMMCSAADAVARIVFDQPVGEAGYPSNLDMAIEQLKVAAERSSNTETKVKTKCLLGNAYGIRFNRLNEGDDISKAIDAYAGARALADEAARPFPAVDQYSLALHYLRRYDTAAPGQAEDLKRAKRVALQGKEEAGGTDTRFDMILDLVAERMTTANPLTG